ACSAARGAACWPPWPGSYPLGPPARPPRGFALLQETPAMSSTGPRPDKPLFTPGPLTTSAAVKRVMLRDLGSRDAEFMEVVRAVRRGLLAAAGESQGGGYEAGPMQGSGTFGVVVVLTLAAP